MIGNFFSGAILLSTSKRCENGLVAVAGAAKPGKQRFRTRILTELQIY
jgi:hypothetical protein